MSLSASAQFRRLPSSLPAALTGRPRTHVSPFANDTQLYRRFFFAAEVPAKERATSIGITESRQAVKMEHDVHRLSGRLGGAIFPPRHGDVAPQPPAIDVNFAIFVKFDHLHNRGLAPSYIPNLDSVQNEFAPVPVDKPESRHLESGGGAYQLRSRRVIADQKSCLQPQLCELTANNKAGPSRNNSGNPASAGGKPSLHRALPRGAPSVAENDNGIDLSACRKTFNGQPGQRLRHPYTRASAVGGFYHRRHTGAHGAFGFSPAASGACR